MFWEAVKMLNMYGFTVCFSSQDGAQVNRDFVNMFFSIRNIWYPLHPNIVLLMDFSHVIKRVRNNISKSGKSSDSNGNQNKFIRTLKNGDHLVLVCFRRSTDP
jgi:adenine C2-methylase RlmN of 23S rRNA A2503 and tRNA A37